MKLLGLVSLNPEDKDATILVISEKGNGKRTLFEEYRKTNRGGKGVKTMQVTDKTGSVIAIKAVLETNDIMITTKNGIIIRMKVADLRVMGRATQGVRVIRLGKNDEIADVAVLAESEEEEIIELNEDGTPIENIGDENEAEGTNDAGNDSEEEE
ncbi:MAG: DNA gyrase C-terminal beta-propeller domain-containing protein [Saprospiraceae bacterium]